MRVALILASRCWIDKSLKYSQLLKFNIMTREELIEKVNAALSEEFETPQEDMLPDAPMMEVLDLDSLDIVDVVVLVEKHFGFVMKKEDFRGIKSFADFYDLVESRMAGK